MRKAITLRQLCGWLMSAAERGDVPADIVIEETPEGSRISITMAAPPGVMPLTRFRVSSGIDPKNIVMNIIP